MEGREGDPLLSRYTPSHYILDKGPSFAYPQIRLCYNFHEDLISSFYVTLLTDRVDGWTDKQSDAVLNIRRGPTSLAEVTTSELHSSVHCFI